LDLSGTEQGAGGVGGLLMFTHHGSPVATHFSAYDGNGNVVVLVSASDGSPTAHYEYGPFGDPIRVSGSAAALNPFRFSTKRTDSTTDLVLYEYRAYSSSLGRLANRDPIQEGDALNSYGMVDNDPVNFVDLWGLWRIERKGEARAKAYPDHGDTIRALAEEIQLNASEWKLWLKVESTSVANLDLDTPLDCSNVFSVPNTAFVDASSYSWGVLGWYLMKYSSDLRSAWKSEGLKVIYTSTWRTSKDSIIRHLGSDDIYKYAYIGHGASGQLTGLKDPSGEGDEKGMLAAGKYTKYGVARMEIIACESNDSSHLWKKNVSKNGVLRTVKGYLRLFNRNFVDEGGE
jgi:RHS repeat-associated protein